MYVCMTTLKLYELGLNWTKITYYNQTKRKYTSKVPNGKGDSSKSLDIISCTAGGYSRVVL